MSSRRISPETVGWDEWQERVDELRGLWLSRLMFGPLLAHGLAFRETRTFEQFAADHGVEL